MDAVGPTPPLRVIERDELLLDLRDAVVRVEARLMVRDEAVVDHESRLRILEKWRYGIPGGLLLALIAVIHGFMSVPHNW